MVEEEEDHQEAEEAPQLYQVYLHLAPGLQEVEDHQEAEEDCQEEVEDHLSLQQEQQE